MDQNSQKRVVKVRAAEEQIVERDARMLGTRVKYDSELAWAFVDDRLQKLAGTSIFHLLSMVGLAQHGRSQKSFS